MKTAKAQVLMFDGFALIKSGVVWNISRGGNVIGSATTLSLAKAQASNFLKKILKEERHKHQWVFDSQIASGRRLSNGRQQLITRKKCPVCFKKTEWTYSAGGRIRRYYRL